MSRVIIFEGAELSGKSYLISQVYDYIEQRHRKDPHLLDGCHWFNCDVGIFGDRYGRLAIEKYLELAEAMTDRHIIFEKFHITDAAYHQLYKHSILNYADVEKRLQTLRARMVFCNVAPDEGLFLKRLADRIALYPHYARITQTPRDYIRQQEAYRELVARSILPTLTVDTTELPNPSAVRTIINWIRNDEKGY